MSQRTLIRTFTSVGSARVAKVYRDSEWNEYRVNHYVLGVMQEDASYHTTDKDEALEHAANWVNLTPVAHPEAVSAPAGTIDLTPTWGEWARIYIRFAETGERKACHALRADLARIAATAEAMKEIVDTLTPEQNAIVARVIPAELAKLGY